MAVHWTEVTKVTTRVLGLPCVHHSHIGLQGDNPPFFLCSSHRVNIITLICCSVYRNIAPLATYIHNMILGLLFTFFPTPSLLLISLSLSLSLSLWRYIYIYILTRTHKTMQRITEHYIVISWTRSHHGTLFFPFLLPIFVPHNPHRYMNTFPSPENLGPVSFVSNVKWMWIDHNPVPKPTQVCYIHTWVHMGMHV